MYQDLVSGLSKYRQTIVYWLFFSCLSACTLVPLIYLIYKMIEMDFSELCRLLFRPVTFNRILNSVGLVLSVTTCSWLIAAPLSFGMLMLSTKAQKWVALCALLPLTIPGYVLAYSLSALGNPADPIAQVLGTPLPQLKGFWGATFALTLYNMPLLFLSLTSALQKVGRTRFEAGRSLGLNLWQVSIRVLLPALRGPGVSGSLLIALYVLGDFGVSSLLRVDTLSYAIFVNWSQPSYAALLSLVLSIHALIILAIAWRIGSFTPEGAPSTNQWPWIRPTLSTSTLICSFAGILIIPSFVLPLISAMSWLQGDFASVNDIFIETIFTALQLGIIATVVNVCVSLLFATWLRPSMNRWQLVTPQLGYALPPLVIALGLISLSLTLIPSLRDGFVLLYLGLLIHGLSLSLGPTQSAVDQLRTQWINAARGLGASRFRRLFIIVLPNLRAGLGVASVLTFLSVVKELPLTKLLAPVGTRTLALEAWSYADEGLYMQAAPFALTLILLSMCATWLSIRTLWRTLNLA